MVLHLLLFSVTIIRVISINSSTSNESEMYESENSKLPLIKDGDPCEPYKLYRMDCNICKCGLKNALLCTKMVCLTQESIDKAKSMYRKSGDDGSLNINKYPNLPNENCVPGNIYQKGCKRCYCDSNKKVKCSQRDICNTLKGEIGETPEDIGSEFTSEEIDNLPELPNAASKCEPGVIYKVDCNTCFCKANHNMVCSQVLCLSTEDMNRLGAKKLTGTPCKTNDKPEVNSCIKCYCIKGVSKCNPVPGCFPSMIRKSLQGSIKKIKLDLQLTQDRMETCVPGAVYKDNCNRCYCQKDKKLTCTKKSCLNYIQALNLNKDQIYLEKHGL